MMRAKKIQRENAVRNLIAEEAIQIKALEHDLEVRNISVSEGFHINSWEFKLLIFFKRYICDTHSSTMCDNGSFSFIVNYLRSLSHNNLIPY
jgi:hypothetical protein